MELSLFLCALLWARPTFIDNACDTRFAKNLLTRTTLDWIYNKVFAYKACDLFKDGGAMTLYLKCARINSGVQTPLTFLLVWNL